MTIFIRPEHENLITRVMQTGGYQNADEVVARALALLQSEEEWLQDHKVVVHDKIERAFAQFERGEFYSAEESRADMKQRKAAWLAEQKP